MYTKEGYPVGSTSSGDEASLLVKKSKGESDHRMVDCSRGSKGKVGNDMDFSIMSPLGIFILKSLSMSIIHMSRNTNWRNWIESNGGRLPYS